jgi:hypothetical protein
MIINANITIEEYLKNLSCSESYFKLVLKKLKIKVHYHPNNYYLGSYISTEHQYNLIIFDPTTKYVTRSLMGIPIIEYNNYCVEYSSLEDLTELINKYKKLKAFI